MVKLINGDSVTEISDLEANAFLSAWSKERHIAEINQLHDELFKSILLANNYIDMAELGIWAQQPDSLFRNEATAIKAWYINTCEIICNYETTVNEQNAVEPIEFIDNLPKYE